MFLNFCFFNAKYILAQFSGIHEEMLKDTVRTKTYMRAIKSNPQLFRGKIVLDIGAGTGILSLFAAQAGARHVYAIECADIARHARLTIEENGFADKITVIQQKVEEITSLTGNEEEDIKVDVIISEWMGYFLLYESMLDTVLFARDKWLKPNGVLLPDTANLYMCAVEDGEYMDEKINFWNDVYGFRMSSLREEAMKEPLVDVVDGNTIVSNIAPILEIDLNTVTKEDLDFTASFRLDIIRDDHVHALVSFFDVIFSRTHTRIGFTTSPRAEYTHWKQTVFYLDDQLMVSRGTFIEGRISVKRNANNPRDLDINMRTSYTNSKIPNYTPISQRRKYLMR